MIIDRASIKDLAKCMDHWISAIHSEVPVSTQRIPMAFRYNRRERRGEKRIPSRDHSVYTRDLVFMKFHGSLLPFG